MLETLLPETPHGTKSNRTLAKANSNVSTWLKRSLIILVIIIIALPMIRKTSLEWSWLTLPILICGYGFPKEIMEAMLPAAPQQFFQSAMYRLSIIRLPAVVN